MVDIMGNEIKRGDFIGVVAGGVINKGVFDKEAKSGTIHWHSIRSWDRGTPGIAYAAAKIQSKERPKVEFSTNTSNARFVRLDPSNLVDHEKISFEIIKDYLDPQV